MTMVAILPTGSQSDILRSTLDLHARHHTGPICQTPHWTYTLDTTLDTMLDTTLDARARVAKRGYTSQVRNEVHQAYER
jgi:hypothetical protein